MISILTIYLGKTTNHKTRHFVVAHNANKTPPLPCLTTLEMSVNLSCCAYAIIRLVCSYKEKPGSVLSSDGKLEVDIVTRLRAGCVRASSIHGKRKTFMSSPNDQDKRRGPPHTQCLPTALSSKTKP
jgi:hypothetical protein